MHPPPVAAAHPGINGHAVCTGNGNHGPGGFGDLNGDQNIGFWDAFMGEDMPTFGSEGQMGYYPDDWGLPKYNGSETFALAPWALFSDMLFNDFGDFFGPEGGNSSDLLQQQSPISGPGGGSVSVFGETDAERLTRLKECAKGQFGVDLRTFTPSLPKLPGSFVGSGPDGKVFTIENDSMTYSTTALSIKANGLVGYIFGSRTVGLTDPSAPYTNYTANDSSPRETLYTQVHELAHSLGDITRRDASEGAAGKFTDCVFSVMR